MAAMGTTFLKSIKRTAIPDLVLHGLERCRGLSYPNSLIGRRNVLSGEPRNAPVLVFAAHPDDEALGLGLTLIRHRANADGVVVVFTTNGAHRSWTDSNRQQEVYANQRLREARSALGLIGIPPACIINLGFPDAGLRRFIPEAVKDIESLLVEYRPKIVYVHAMEGGHRDHDVTSFLVQSTCARLASGLVYEWAEYNREIPLAQHVSSARFPPDPYIENFRCLKIPFTDEERKLKVEMLKRYSSQKHVIERYPLRDELLREAKPVDLAKRLAYFADLSPSRLRYLRVFTVTTR